MHASILLISAYFLATVKKQDNRLYTGLGNMSTLSSYLPLKTMQKWDNHITKATDFS